MRRVVTMLALLALTGCGDDGEEADAPPPAAATSTTGEAAPDGDDDDGGGDTDEGEGEDGLPEPTDASADPAVVAARALTSSDAGVACAELVTPGYVAEAYGDVGGCAAAVAEGGAADRLEVHSTEAGATEATVEARATGGAFGGQRLTVTLVADGAGWLVDAVESHTPVGP